MVTESSTMFTNDRLEVGKNAGLLLATPPAAAVAETVLVLTFAMAFPPVAVIVPAIALEPVAVIVLAIALEPVEVIVLAIAFTPVEVIVLAIAFTPVAVIAEPIESADAVASCPVVAMVTYWVLAGAAAGSVTE